MQGKHILITGATNGIGLAAAEALAALGASIAIVGRSETRTRIAAAQVGAKGATVAIFVADLSSQASVRTLAAEVLARYPRLDVLINNAGAMHGARQLTKDGIELTWALNHLAPFLLTTLLLDLMKASAPAGIITTASDAHLVAEDSAGTQHGNDVAPVAAGVAGEQDTARYVSVLDREGRVAVALPLTVAGDGAVS